MSQYAYHKRKLRNGTTRDAHRLAVEARINRKLTRQEVVHHINGDKLDNRPENLQVMTLAEHSRLHRQRGETGIITEAGKASLRRHFQGERSTSAKLDNNAVCEIVRLRSEGQRLVFLAIKFGVSERSIRNILTGKTWSHVTCIGGAPQATAMAIVGHRSESISNHYTHVDADALRKATSSMPDVT